MVAPSNNEKVENKKIESTKILLVKLSIELILVIIYGLMIWVIANFLIGTEPSPFNIFALGLIWRFLKEELPLVFRRYVGEKQ